MSQSPVFELAADRVAGALRARIAAGDLAPATPLRDAALAQSFSVSRNTVREAFRMLRHDGLVEHQLHRGVVVRSLGVDDVHDIYRVRHVVEVRAIQESVLAPSAAMDAVGEAVTRAEAAVADRAFADVGTASLAFHQALVGLLGSPTLNGFFDTVVARLRLAFAVMEDEAAFQEPWVPRDRQIWQLLLAGDRRRAEDVLRSYLDDSHRKVVDVVRAHASTATAASTRPVDRREHSPR
jgi:DNA-binding GntR family transcriptional regulator